MVLAEPFPGWPRFWLFPRARAVGSDWFWFSGWKEGGGLCLNESLRLLPCVKTKWLAQYFLYIEKTWANHLLTELSLNSLGFRICLKLSIQYFMKNVNSISHN